MSNLGVPFVDEPSVGHINDWAKHPHQAGINPAYRLDHPMTLEGTIGGFYNMSVSGSSVNYWVTPPDDEVYWIARILVSMQDSVFTRADRYGATASLPTGIAIHVEDDALDVIHNFTPVRIQDISHWSLLGGVDITTIGGAGSDPLYIRWTLERSGAYLVLDGRDNHRLKMEIPDDLGAGGAALDQHIVVVQGVRLKVPGATI